MQLPCVWLGCWFLFSPVQMLALPLVLGVNGVWLATPAAELMALALSAALSSIGVAITMPHSSALQMEIYVR